MPAAAGWVVNFEVFRDDLEAAMVRSDRVKGRRPSFDCMAPVRSLDKAVVFSIVRQMGSRNMPTFFVLNRPYVGT